MADSKVTDEGLEQLAALEERIGRAVALLQSARAEKEELLKENVQGRRQLAEQDQLLRSLQERLRQFEKERDSVKTRVQKILDQVDTLAQAAADGS